MNGLDFLALLCLPIVLVYLVVVFIHVRTKGLWTTNDAEERERRERT